MILGHTRLAVNDLKRCTGSSSIVDEKTREPLLSVITLIVETAVKLRQDGHRVVIVSSGAIAVGLRRMDVGKKPKHLPTIQVNFPKYLLAAQAWADLDERHWQQ